MIFTLIVAGIALVSLCVVLIVIVRDTSRNPSPAHRIKILILGLTMAAIATFIMAITYPWILFFLNTGVLPR